MRLAFLFPVVGLICSLSGVSLPSARAETPAAPAIVLPFQWDRCRQPHPLVMAKVKGISRLLPFLVDTGSGSPVILDEQIASEAGVKDIGQPIPGKMLPEGFRMGGETAVEILGSEVNNGLTLNLKQVAIGALSRTPSFAAYGPIGGILGAPVFAQLRTRFDFFYQRITFYRSEGSLPPPADPAGVTALAMRLDNAAYPGLFAVQLTPAATAPGGRPAHPLNLMFDTGAENSTLSAGDADAFAPLRLSKVEGTFSTLRGREPRQRARVSSFAFGDLAEPNVDFDLLSKTSSYPSVLGINFLCRFIVTLDPVAGKVVFERAPDYADQVRHERGTSDITLASKGDMYVIDKIQDGSPAKDAELARGDVLLSIDGISVDSIRTTPPAQAYGLLAGFAGTTATLRVSRSGTAKEITYTRKGYF